MTPELTQSSFAEVHLLPVNVEVCTDMDYTYTATLRGLLEFQGAFCQNDWLSNVKFQKGKKEFFF